MIAQQKRDEAQAQWRAADQLAQAARAQYDMAQKGARPEDKTAAAAQARQVGAVLTEAQIALAETKIAAPVAGQVSKIQIQPGELAPQGFPVITLVNLADAWAVLQVREMKWPLCHAARIRQCAALNGKEVKGQLRGRAADFARARGASGGTD